MNLIQEEWKAIQGYEGLYQVSNLGRIKKEAEIILYRDGRRRHNKPHIMSVFDKGNGYIEVRLRDRLGAIKKERVHRLVAKAFLPIPEKLRPLASQATKSGTPKLIINHKDENPANNNVDNLEWCTHGYNSRYGNSPRKVSEALSRKVYCFTKDGALVKSYPSIRNASKETGISISGISRSALNKRSSAGGYIWKYVNN